MGGKISAGLERHRLESEMAFQVEVTVFVELQKWEKLWRFGERQVFQYAWGDAE